MSYGLRVLPAGPSAEANLVESGDFHFSAASYTYRTIVKRAVDILLTALGSPFILALILPIAFVIAMNGGKPFYSQARVGKDGRTFTIWKLRTMVRDADRVLEAHFAANPEARDEWNRNQKLRHDPRITRMGELLRRSSLDELPQFYNVLRGDMSLVGPRPMMLCQQELYPGTEYYLMRPGITGFWQTSARNGVTFADRARFDRLYYRRQSLRTDLGVLARTVFVVLRGSGC